MSGSAPTTWLALAGTNPAPLLAWLGPWLVNPQNNPLPAPQATGPAHPGATPAAHPTGGNLQLVLAVAPEDWPTLVAALHAVAGWQWPEWAAGELPQWPDGFHRLTAPSWCLTVCLGNVADQVQALGCRANHLWVAGQHHTTPRLPQTLARLCVPGAHLSCEAPITAAESAAWAQAGWTVATHGTPHSATYLPRWPVPALPTPGRAHAVVIGAGLAGAAMCHSLTQRGWLVDLIDQHPGPAQGASALPVGMLSEHVTASETVLSALSRAGMALHLRELHALVPQGAGWQATHVSNLRQAVPVSAHATPQPAAMVRPAALVQAWLTQAQATGLLRTHWGCTVAGLALGTEPVPEWRVLDAQSQPLAQAPHVVVTAAYGSAELLAPHMAAMATLGDTAHPDNGHALRPVKGQMTYAPLVGAPFAQHTLRDHGVYVPCYEDTAHPTAPRLWTMGSTYERGQNNRTTTADAHERNAASLQSMVPLAHDRLRQQQADGELLGWAEVRCASLDRLPLVGGVPAASPALVPNSQLGTLARVPGLWTLCALGSRGLTLSKLAAELLVAHLLGEPLPMSKRHADALDPARFALQAARKTAGKTAGKKAGK